MIILVYVLLIASWEPLCLLVLSSLSPSDPVHSFLTSILTYLSLYLGEQHVGKSSFINYVLSVWFGVRTCLLQAPIGTKIATGTKAFDGPYELIVENEETKKRHCIFELYDAMGYLEKAAAEPKDTPYIQFLLAGIATGTVKPGFVQYSAARGIFQPVIKEDFSGVDLFVVTANYNKEDQVKRAAGWHSWLESNCKLLV